MVSNTSGNAQVANVFLNFNGRQRPSPALAFNPHETKILSVADLLSKLNVSVAQAPQGSITFIQQGANPALIAQGRVVDPATGFSSTLEFPDPTRQKASALHASGLPIGTPTTDSPFAGDGTFTPHVIASNLTSAPQMVTVTMEYPRSAGLQPGRGAILAPVGKKEFDGESGASVGQMTVASFSVAAYSTEDFSLAAVMSELPLPLPYASVRIQYSGPPGSLLAQAPSVDERQDLVIDTRTMNEGDGWAGSGANPWHLDNQTESILFLTDESDQPARIGFHVTVGSVTYYLTPLKLNPHETWLAQTGVLDGLRFPEGTGARRPELIALRDRRRSTASVCASQRRCRRDLNTRTDFALKRNHRHGCATLFLAPTGETVMCSA